MRLPKRKSEMNRRHDGQDDYLTPEALRKIKDELRRHERTRPKVVEDLSEARELGDLSENAAYQHAKGRLAGIDRRMFILKEKIKNAVIIEAGPDPEGRVRIGSRVAVEVNGKKKEFLMTGTQEADPSTGRISHKSPVGSKLVGLRAGETATVKVSDRDVEYSVLEVS
ncbi:MAG: GreA/GreB family elongation factor [Patescibacteria group bacterium]|nr:GreA/GreB family elongation factor [Patescibacteria group bacterium]